MIGAENSSNSNRLRDLGEEIGIKSHLIADSSEFNPNWLEGVGSVGITAGASAPEHLIEGLIAAIKSQFDCCIKTLQKTEENIHFKLPKEVRDITKVC